jgi:hypothetical protein
MPHASFLIVLFWCAFCFAKFEICVEGKDGWATRLPTWRLPSTHWMSRIFFGGREATGYHVWLQLFFLSILHTIYLFQPLALKVELKVLSFFILFWVLEDFLWFVLNPAYTIKRFKKEHIAWHPHWWLGMPREYVIFLPIGILLYLIALAV